MNHRRLRQGLQFALRHISLILFAVVLVAFALLSDRFLSVRNLTNIVIQAAHVGILGIGMTFVLLTAGIDLSVGAVMYLGAATLGTYFIGLPLWLGLLAVCGVGMAFGAANAIVITRLGVAAFITTLATLFIGRGLALFVTGTQVVVLPQEILQFGRTTLLGVSWSVWAFGAVLAISWFVLTQTTFGRQVYAVGADLDAAGKAGIKVGRVLFLVYVICGLLAAIAGLVSASQVGTVSPTFALQKEFAAVAAAVLGGTSLFGGRGSAYSALLGIIVIQSIASGLTLLDLSSSLRYMITGGVLAIAVIVDSLARRSRVSHGRA